MSMAEGSDPMTADVIQLPRPRQARTGPAPLAFFVRVGFNDHREMLELITVGERGFFGFVRRTASGADRGGPPPGLRPDPRPEDAADGPPGRPQ
jgi:hypothetical protein